MLEEHVDLFAGDFNGAAWHRSNGNTRQPTSIIEEAFADTDLPMPLGPTPLWGPGAIPGKWIDVCGFIKPPDSCENGRSAYMELSQFPTVPKCGCTWTLLTTSMLTCHEGNTSSGSFSKKGPLHTRLDNGAF